MTIEGRQATTLHELLDVHGIQLHEIPRLGGPDHGGSRSKMVCPQCQGGRTKERNFYVRIDDDGLGFRAFCQRGSCGFKATPRLASAPLAARTHWEPKVYRRPEPPLEIDRPASLLAYFAGFGISADTVRALGIYRAERSFPLFDKSGAQVPGEQARRAVIAYPYRQDGALLNVKYKAIYGKTGIKRFKQEPDAEQSLYNIDSFSSDAVGLIVEGEDDVAACFECGFRQTTSVVDGAPAKLAESYDPQTDDDKRYIAFKGNAKIAALKRIILAGDMDVTGRNHHAEIARRVGAERCWVVSWPDGCKDAKDTLHKRGRDAVRFCIEHATPYPVEGLAPIGELEATALYMGTGRGRYLTGYAALDDRLALAENGRFVVTTGNPGHGKSTFWQAMATLYINRANQEMETNPYARPFHVVVFSGEVANDRVAADLISQHLQKPFFAHPVLERLTLSEMLKARDEWVNRHFTFISWPERGVQPTLAWIKEKTRIAVRRTGAKLVIWDPWQEIDDEMPASWRKTSSEWIGKCLQGVVGLCDELKTNIVLVTHPAKPKERNKDGTLTAPGGYDIGGSQNFFSRCDIGVTIHRPHDDRTDMEVHVWKAKDNGWYGRVGKTVVRFDPSTTLIWPLPVAVDALQEPIRPWSEVAEG